MRRSVIVVALTLCSTTAFASGLTVSQQTGMFRHGNWSWSVEKCDGVARNKRYWFFLKEGGKFESFSQISSLTEGWFFKRGWNDMQQKALTMGHDQACDYAMEKWPAMLWREKKASTAPDQS